MRKRCSTCGTPAPDEASVFCNRCGARLPDLLTCRKCGNRISDRQSRFCDRCGSPLAPAVQAVPPPITLAKGKICPGCGFENFIEDALFCKKCGTGLRKSGPEGTATGTRPPERPARARPAGRDAGKATAVRTPAAGAPAPVPPQAAGGGEAVNVPEDPKVPPRAQGPEAPKKRSWQQIALVGAGILILVMVIALIAGGVPGILNGGAANATEPDQPGALAAGHMPGPTPVLNRAVPVVTDTSLTPHAT